MTAILKTPSVSSSHPAVSQASVGSYDDRDGLRFYGEALDGFQVDVRDGLAKVHARCRVTVELPDGRRYKADQVLALTARRDEPHVTPQVELFTCPSCKRFVEMLCICNDGRHVCPECVSLHGSEVRS